MRSIADVVQWIASRYRVLLVRRAIGRGFEMLRYSFVRPRRGKRFHIVSAQRNMGEAAIRCLQSVYDQKYPKDLVRHVFFDDASTDDTPLLIDNWIRNHPGNSLEFVRNSERKGMLANNIVGFRMAKPSEIGVELNGDDRLPDPGLLRFLNKVYEDERVWMTFNTLRRSDGTLLFTEPPPRELSTSRNWRQGPWMTSHLHTFRAGLYQRIPPHHFIDPLTGNPWDFAQDSAVYFAMLELAGNHVRHIYRVTCAYNLHEMSEETRDRSAQIEVARRARELEKCDVLDSLDCG